MSPDRSRCENCGSSRADRLYDIRDYVTGEVFEIARCKGCGLVRTIVPEPVHELGRYYDAAYYGQAGRRFAGLMERLIRLFRHRRARLVQRLHPRPGRILDIGCGRGLMLAELQRGGWECAGTEANPELAQAIEQLHGFRVHPTTDLLGLFPAGWFDVITLWHVLEHMQTPVAALREIHRLLKPGGFVIIETPNFASLQSRLGRGRWFHLDAPRHRIHFSSSGLTRILVQQGFRIIHRSTLSLEYGFYGFYQTILNLLTTRPNLLYRRLQTTRPVEAGQVSWVHLFDQAITVMALPGAILLGTLLEAAAAAAGNGGVVQLTATRRGAAVP